MALLQKFLGILGCSLSLMLFLLPAPLAADSDFDGLCDPSWDELKIMVDGMDADAVLQDETKLREVLIKMGADDDPKISKMIKSLRDKNGGKGGKGVSGLGGFTGRSFLDAAEMKLKGDGTYDPTKTAKVKHWGRIEKYNYVPSGTSGAAQFIGDMAMTAYTCSAKVSKKSGDKKRKVKELKFVVHTENNGVSIHQKHSNADPFPGTMAFSPDMIDRVNMLGFEFKVWAEGMNVKVDEVWVDERKPNDPGFKLVPKMGSGPLKKYQGLYTSQAESCIDLMFVKTEGLNDPPYPDLDFPINESQLTGPPFHCLGRCGHPPLINTK